jgi:SAM-dependent methyltransferase
MNNYTPRWFDLFLHEYDPQQTAREISFLCRMLPQPRYVRLLDICCGLGRHTHELARAHYTVLGIDNDEQAVAEARKHALPNETYLKYDMRQLGDLKLQADAVLCLWQSFGYFEAAVNRAVLHSMAAALGVGGRCVLDLYNYDFFVAHQGTRTFIVRGSEITEAKHVKNGRLHVTLTEGAAQPIGTFEWQLFTPEACIQLAKAAGLACITACTRFSEHEKPSESMPRIQYVFEKGNSELI